MKFNIYGRSQLEVRRENDVWEVVRQEPAPMGLIDPFISSVLETEDVATYLDELVGELADFELDHEFAVSYTGKLLS
jgi:hypothetical protein